MSAESSASAADQGPATISILVADDNKLLRRLMRTIFSSDQYTIIEAGDGDLAWRLVQEHQPALALLDIRMPGMTGLQLAQAIKRSPPLQATKVCLLTAEATPEDVRAGYAAGADCYLTKPFSPMLLSTVVQHLLGSP